MEKGTNDWTGQLSRELLPRGQAEAESRLLDTPIHSGVSCRKGGVFGLSAEHWGDVVCSQEGMEVSERFLFD